MLESILNKLRARRPSGLQLLWLAAALALLLGCYARLAGLGAASIDADEYYIIRSVQNILHTGLPRYACGGYYPRGLAYQYLVALLCLGGLRIEVAARLVAALSGLLCLPAAYLLARRAAGAAVAVAVLAVVAVSLWEVEISRFGRMYEPFQAIFLWYAWLFVRLATSGRVAGRLQPAPVRSLLALWLLAALGVLTWEGGVFLAIAGVLLPFVREPTGSLGRRDWLFILANLVLFGAGYGLTIANLRMAGGEPQFPSGYDIEAARALTDAQLSRLPALWHSFWQHGHPQLPWLLGVTGPALLCLRALGLPWRLRDRWPAAVAALVALLAALHGELALTATVLLIALLLGSLELQDLRGTSAAGWFWIALLASSLFWVAFALAHVPPPPPDAEDVFARHALLRVAAQLTQFPDLANLVLRPWLRAVPRLTVLLGALCGVALWLRLSRFGTERTAQGVLLLLLVAMLAAVGASQPPRAETRYEFFLYPLMIVVAYGALAQLAERLRLPASAAMGAALLAFMLTEDFYPRHLIHIDSVAATQRRDMPRSLAEHVVGRSDLQGVAQWLNEHAAAGALTINAFPSADYYYPRFELTYIAADSPRFRAYACRRGTFERWGNRPLVFDAATLEQRITAVGGAYVVAGPTQEQEFRTSLAALQPRTVFQTADGEVKVLALGDARR